MGTIMKVSFDKIIIGSLVFSMVVFFITMLIYFVFNIDSIFRYKNNYYIEYQDKVYKLIEVEKQYKTINKEN
jgi:hypothetical protein